MTFKDPDQVLIDLIDKDIQDIVLIQRALASGASPNAMIMHEMETKDAEGLPTTFYTEFPILARAILRGNANAVSALLSAGAKIESPFVMGDDVTTMKVLARLMLSKNQLNKNAIAIMQMVKERSDAHDRSTFKRPSLAREDALLSA